MNTLTPHVNALSRPWTSYGARILRDSWVSLKMIGTFLFWLARGLLRAAFMLFYISFILFLGMIEMVGLNLALMFYKLTQPL